MAKSLDTPHLNDVIYKYMHNKIYRVLFCGSLSLVGLTIVTGSLLSNIVPSVAAESSSTATATVNVSSSCSLSATVDAEHTATLLNGIYSGNDNYPNGIGSTTIKAVCNDNAGFAIYAVGFSGDTYGDNTMIGTSGATIPTGTATSGANSQWAMKLAKVTDATAYNPANLTITNNYDAYHAVPNDYEKVASFSSATDQTLGSKLTATYAAYISNTQAADTYTGKVKYTLVHPATNEPNKPYACQGGKICYFPNAGNELADRMSDQTIGSTATSKMLWVFHFKRPGYGFAGWSDKYDWVLGANDASGNGTGENAGYHIYGPNQTIEFEAGQYSEEGLSLYAVWVPSAGNLQTWSCPRNDIMPVGSVTALTDLRDNNTYAVAKLADDRCWMIENLRLDHTNSDNATGALAQGYGTSNTYGNFVGLAEPETTTFYNVINIPNSIYYSGTQSGTATIDIGTTNNPGYRIPRYSNVNIIKTDINMTGSDQDVYGYGNYYNWPAARANTSYMSNASESDVATSICPRFWSLPTGTGSGEFGVLSNSMGGYKDANDVAQPMNSNTTPTGEEMSKIMRAFPNNIVYSGQRYRNSIENRDYAANYWTMTASGSDSAYILFITNTDVSFGSKNKYYGISVRCIAPPSK